MAKDNAKIRYDFEEYILNLSRGKNSQASLEIGDFILDVSHNNLICGLEVMDASENLGISKDILKNIRNIKMSVTYKTNHVYVLLILAFKKKGKEVNVPIPLTLDLGHKVPKKEVLVYG